MKVGFALLNSVTIKQGMGGEAAPSTESALFSGCFKVTNVFCWVVSDTCRKEKARKSKEVSGGRTGWEAMSELGHCRTPPVGGDLGDTKHHSFTGDEFYPSGSCLFLLGPMQIFSAQLPSTPHLRGQPGSGHLAPNPPREEGEDEEEEAPPSRSRICMRR